MGTARYDAVIVGAGLAGLVAAHELLSVGKRIALVEQESPGSLGGQAWWSFGGLFLVDTPEQRRLGIRDSLELARDDWFGSAGFDRADDLWPRRWAQAYLDFAAGEKRAWLTSLGLRFFPVVGWAERGGHNAGGHGNSVPRFHIVWGTGPGILAPFVRSVRAAHAEGRVDLLFRHRADALVGGDGRVTGVRGSILAQDRALRGQPTNRTVVGDFELAAEAILITSGGLGGDVDAVRRHWPGRLGTAPAHMLSGVPAHVDGRMLDIAESAGAHLINRDRMWHYTEGISHYAPVWPHHGIRILPGPSSLWLDATGARLPSPFLPGFDTLGTLEHIMATGHDHSWFILTRRIAEKEFALSGSEQNPDLTGRSIRQLATRLLPGAPSPVQAFVDRGADFVTADTLGDLIEGMQRLSDVPLDAQRITRHVHERDRQLDNVVAKDPQIIALRAARSFLGDRLIRVAPPHSLLDPAAGPLIAVRLHILTRKTLGGIKTDLGGRVLTADDVPIAGLYAAGEAAGFGGGGLHGYRSLEGTFLGGCLFSARVAARTAATA